MKSHRSKLLVVQCLLFCLTIVPFSTLGQGAPTTDFLEQIQEYDVSDLWTTNHIHPEGDSTTIDRPEPLGYIGDQFQRLYIHFISVIQNSHNPLEYFVYGKTRVKTNICRFQGRITIEEAFLYTEGDIPGIDQGYVQGTYTFFEDPEQSGTGIFEGNFRTDFYFDDKGTIQYDALMIIADGYRNNQFEGTWTSYRSGTVKECNWGDYRIPEGRGLDVGAGNFSPAEKYNKNGWESYRSPWEKSPKGQVEPWWE